MQDAVYACAMNYVGPYGLRTIRFLNIFYGCKAIADGFLPLLIFDDKE
jgi:hypothetical protein